MPLIIVWTLSNPFGKWNDTTTPQNIAISNIEGLSLRWSYFVLFCCCASTSLIAAVIKSIPL